MSQWDKFAKTYLRTESFSEDSMRLDQVDNKFYFKKSDPESYQRFREVTQILDLLQLTVDTLQYNTAALAAALIYLTTGRALGLFSYNDFENQDSLSEFLLEKDSSRRFNQIYEVFLQQTLGYTLGSLISSLEYVSQYLAVEGCWKAPSTIKNNLTLVFRVKFIIYPDY